MAYRVYFHRTERGQCRVREFLRKLPHKARRKCMEYLKRVRANGKQCNASVLKHLESELWEVRPEFGGIEYRFLIYYHSDEVIGVVHAFAKKRQIIERGTIETALRLIEELKVQIREREDE